MKWQIILHLYVHHFCLIFFLSKEYVKYVLGGKINKNVSIKGIIKEISIAEKNFSTFFLQKKIIWYVLPLNSSLFIRCIRMIMIDFSTHYMIFIKCVGNDSTQNKVAKSYFYSYNTLLLLRIHSFIQDNKKLELRYILDKINSTRSSCLSIKNM